MFVDPFGEGLLLNGISLVCKGKKKGTFITMAVDGFVVSSQKETHLETS